MKIIYLFVCICLIAVVFLYKSENLVPTKSDLEKYPELKPFLVGQSSFKGIRFNLDTNYFSFSFSTSLNSAEEYFYIVNNNAIQNNWYLAQSKSNLSRIYIHKDILIGTFQSKKVTLFYNLKGNVITLIREENY